MSSAGWKRRLVVVMVGVVVGFGGLAGQPADAQDARGDRGRGCSDCYYDERPSGQCGRQAPCRQCGQGQGCSDCYYRDRPCDGRDRPPPCRDCYYDAPAREYDEPRNCYDDDRRPCGERDRKAPARDCEEKARRDRCDDRTDCDDYDSRCDDRRSAPDRQDRDGKHRRGDSDRDEERSGLERLIRRIFD